MWFYETIRATSFLERGFYAPQVPLIDMAFVSLMKEKSDATEELDVDSTKLFDMAVTNKRKYYCTFMK